MNPIPHGAPGVASSMNLPNSGWNIGSVSFLGTSVGVSKGDIVHLTLVHPVSQEHIHLEQAISRPVQEIARYRPAVEIIGLSADVRRIQQLGIRPIHDLATVPIWIQYTDLVTP